MKKAVGGGDHEIQRAIPLNVQPQLAVQAS